MFPVMATRKLVAKVMFNENGATRYYWNDDMEKARHANSRLWSSVYWTTCADRDEDDSDNDEFEGVEYDDACRQARAKRDLQPTLNENNEAVIALPAGCTNNIAVSAEIMEANRSYPVTHGARNDDAEAMAAVASWNPVAEQPAEPPAPADEPVAPAGEGNVDEDVNEDDAEDMPQDIGSDDEPTGQAKSSERDADSDEDTGEDVGEVGDGY